MSPVVVSAAWFHADGWPSPEEWQALFAGLTFCVAVAAGVIALLQLRAHFAQQREQSRPYVIVDFAFESMVVLIQVKNIGSTAAMDVRFSWDPEPRGMDDDATEAIRRNLVEGEIPFLAPGREIRYFLAAGMQMTPESDITQRLHAVAEYTDLAGRRYGGDEVMILDFAQWSDAAVDTDYDNQNLNINKRREDRERRAESREQKVLDLLGPISVFFREQSTVKRHYDQQDLERQKRRTRLDRVLNSRSASRTGEAESK